MGETIGANDVCKRGRRIVQQLSIKRPFTAAESGNLQKFATTELLRAMQPFIKLSYQYEY
jgi:hypothetical protein